MIIVNSRNRHNAYGHLLQLLAGPRAEKHASTTSMQSPLVMNLARPDELVDLLPGLTEKPESVMRAMLRMAGECSGAPTQMGEPVVGNARLHLSASGTVQFGLAGFDKVLTSCTTLQHISLQGIANADGSMYATVGFVHQLLAEALDKDIGPATFYINNLWVTNAALEQSKLFIDMPGDQKHSVYSDALVRPTEVLSDVDLKTFAEDCRLFLYDNVQVGLRSQWMRRVALPVIHACHHVDQTGGVEEAKEIIDQCEARDWRLAVTSYIEGHPLRVEA